MFILKMLKKGAKCFYIASLNYLFTGYLLLKQYSIIILKASLN